MLRLAGARAPVILLLYFEKAVPCVIGQRTCKRLRQGKEQNHVGYGRKHVKAKRRRVTAQGAEAFTR